MGGNCEGFSREKPRPASPDERAVIVHNQTNIAFVCDIIEVLDYTVDEVRSFILLLLRHFTIAYIGQVYEIAYRGLRIVGLWSLIWDIPSV